MTKNERIDSKEKKVTRYQTILTDFDSYVS